MELRAVLPQEVLDFVAECRKQSYALDAEPNYRTGNEYESGFRFESDGLVYVDVSTEQGRFAGSEHVAIKSVNPGLNGKKYYVCQYAGHNEPDAELVGRRTVSEAQHGFVIAHPTLVRFGIQALSLEATVDGKKFWYSEGGTSFHWGQVNRESLMEVGALGKIHPVYSGSSQVTIFEIN